MPTTSAQGDCRRTGHPSTMHKPAAPYFDRRELRARADATVDARRRCGRGAPARSSTRLKTALRRGAPRTPARAARRRRQRHALRAAPVATSRTSSSASSTTSRVAHVYRATNPSDAERIAVVAVGGYGRGTLAPGSDIDLLFLLPYKQTPWGESVIEFMLYLLWDLGLKVGHATRSVDECIRLVAAPTSPSARRCSKRASSAATAQLFDELDQRASRRGRARAPRATSSPPSWPSATSATQQAGESAATWSSPTSRTARAACATSTRCSGSPKYIFGRDAGRAAVEAGMFTRRELPTFRRCEDFLWAVRCHLHFLTGRRRGALTFDLQPELAERLGYTRSRAA